MVQGRRDPQVVLVSCFHGARLLFSLGRPPAVGRVYRSVVGRRRVLDGEQIRRGGTQLTRAVRNLRAVLLQRPLPLLLTRAT